MANSVYKINKGINKPIEFKGLKAQWIWYLGAGVLILMILFAILYILGVNSYLCIALILIAGAVLFFQIYRVSNKYGEFGLMKKIARRKVPRRIKIYSGKIFMNQNNKAFKV